MNTKVRTSENVVSTELDDEVVIMSVADGRYYSLNSVGAVLWREISTPKTLSYLCNFVEQNFEVSSEICRKDVLSLTEQLYNVGLVEIVE